MAFAVRGVFAFQERELGTQYSCPVGDEAQWEGHFDSDPADFINGGHCFGTPSKHSLPTPKSLAPPHHSGVTPRSKIIKAFEAKISFINDAYTYLSGFWGVFFKFAFLALAVAGFGLGSADGGKAHPWPGEDEKRG
ncbi:hypothetical protein BDK51DRAFT_25813 [Blyttiomyces helicus]|uniref:Uncharacterized protein n=1 Tax=Blyttiomyces helicus TaxID=388810 RepID=A0A4P9WNP6_9FUNG|nr:hypothetical protein BDK51DRAFT_25813 [Blyttiomyces helicus]|eukprot:RKO92820.1 hypothetical protein BDK51DRAFT_25813 [Blyttiomyces helicus]